MCSPSRRAQSGIPWRQMNIQCNAIVEVGSRCDDTPIHDAYCELAKQAIGAFVHRESMLLGKNIQYR